MNRPEVAERGKVVLLAAGRSMRMGRPKQLLPVAGTTLLQHGIRQAEASGIGEVIVVLGANATMVREQSAGNSCTWLENKDWEEGMASSIRCAVQYMIGQEDNPDGAVFMVCDQPHVTGELLRKLWDRMVSAKNMPVACYYDGRLGTPAAFPADYFEQLIQLKGDQGAGKFLNENPEKVVRIPFPEGVLDLDTEEEYNAFIHGTTNDR